jgi:hypothetical protein
MPKFVSVNKASDLLGLSTNTVYKYIKEGKIDSRRIGKGRIKILYSSLAPFIGKKVNDEGVETSIEKKTNNTDSIGQVKTSSEQGQVSEEVGYRQDSYKNVNEQGILTERKEEDANQNTPTDHTQVVHVKNMALSDVNRQRSNASVHFLENYQVKPDGNDLVFFRLFKGFLLIGLGVVNYTTGLLDTFSAVFIDAQLTGIVIKLLPFTFIIGGFIVISQVLINRDFKIAKVWLHTFLVFVLGIYTYLSLSSGHYGLLVWTVSLLAVEISHFTRGLGIFEREVTYSSEFVEYSLFLAVLGGIVVIAYPYYMPIPSVSEFIFANRSVAALLWYVSLLPPLIYFMSPGGKNSKLRTAFFLFFGLIAVYIGQELTFKERWDVSYMSYLTGFFAITLGIWLNQRNIKIVTSQVFLVVIAASWMSASLLFGLFGMSYAQKSVKEQTRKDLEKYAQKAADNLNSFFLTKQSVMITYIGKNNLQTVLEEKDEEKAIEKAKEIYEKLGDVKRVMILDKDGLSLGVYPRNSLIQGTDFSSRGYFSDTKKASRGQISELFESVLSTDIIIQTEPIFKINDFQGMIVSAIDQDNLDKVLLYDTPQNYLVHYLDGNGRYVVGSDKDLYSSMVDATSTFGRSEYPDQPSPITTSLKAGVTGWGVYMEVSTEPIIEKASNMNIILTAVLVVNAVVSLAAAVSIASSKEKERKTVVIPAGSTAADIKTTSV